MPSSRFTRQPIFASALISCGTFIVYAAGACRTIYVGDSGELVAAAATLGIPHPSGYPLYVLLGKLWITMAPVGSIAFRMSLFSALFGALACGLFFAMARRQGLSGAASLLGSLCLAFGPSFWSQATIQRVYTLGGFFVVAVTACALEWYRTRRLGWLVLAALAAGLGTANHTVMGVVGVAVGVFAVISEPGLLRRPHHLAACVGMGCIGLLPYLYLPWRSRHNPRLDWGNPETLDALIAAMTRRDFWHRAWIETPGDFLIIIGDYLRGLGEELAWAGAVLALIGLTWGFRRFPLLLPILIMAANLGAVGLHGSRSDIFIWHRYYIPSYVMAALLAAWGTELAAQRWGRRAGIALLVPAALVALGWPRFDRSHYRIADDFSRQLLATLPPGASLVASDDNILFVLIYLQQVEGLRPDIDLIMQGVGDADLGQLRFDPDEDPLYFTHHPNWNVAGLDVVPIGLTFRTQRAGQTLPEPIVPTTELAGEADPRVPRDYLTQNLVGHFHYMLGITFEQRDWPRAADEFRQAADAAPSNDVLFYNLGLIYRRNGLLHRSLAAFVRSFEINPRHIASNSPVRLGDRVAELEREVERLEALEQRVATEAGLVSTADSTAYHHQMAELLAAQGENLLARGHRLLALESR